MSGFQPPNQQYQSYADPSNPYGGDPNHEQGGGYPQQSPGYGSQEGYDYNNGEDLFLVRFLALVMSLDWKGGGRYEPGRESLEGHRVVHC